MKRADALQPLSRDHLKALLAAKAVREALDVPAATRAFQEFWAAEQDHFRIEEEVLLPTWAAFAEADEAMVMRTLTDHLHIRARAVQLADGGLSLPALHDLGQRLHDHVRFEERELFPQIERSLNPEQLDRLAAALGDLRGSAQTDRPGEQPLGLVHEPVDVLHVGAPLAGEVPLLLVGEVGRGRSADRALDRLLVLGQGGGVDGQLGVVPVALGDVLDEHQLPGDAQRAQVGADEAVHERARRPQLGGDAGRPVDGGQGPGDVGRDDRILGAGGRLAGSADHYLNNAAASAGFAAEA